MSSSESIESEVPRRRAEDSDPLAQFNFNHRSTGILNRLVESTAGEHLRFRRATEQELVTHDAAVAFGDLFEELCGGGVLRRITGLRTPEFIRSGEVPREDLQRLLFSQYGSVCSEEEPHPNFREINVPQRNYHESEDDFHWPPSFSYNFFLSSLLSSTPRSSEQIREYLSFVISEERAREAAQGDPRPPLSDEYFCEGKTPRSFGADLWRVYRCGESESPEVRLSKGFLVVGNTIIARPHFAFKNTDKRVFEFTEAGVVITSFTTYALRKIPFENVSLYRTMSVNEAMSWDLGRVDSIISHGNSLKQRSRRGRVNWGHSEPSIHWSVMRRSWREDYPNTVVRKIIVPRSFLVDLSVTSDIDFGISVGTGREDEHQMEVAIRTQCAEKLLPYFQSNLS